MSEKAGGYREKPTINREQVRREDRMRQRCAQKLEQVAALLREDECLGEARREGQRIVFSVVPAEEGEATHEDEAAQRVLTQAWWEAPA